MKKTKQLPRRERRLRWRQSVRFLGRLPPWTTGVETKYRPVMPIGKNYDRRGKC